MVGDGVAIDFEHQRHGPTGTISGTPTVAGTYSSVVVTAQDAAGAMTTYSYTLTVNPAAATYTISGHVTGQGSALAGATVTLSGGSTGTATTGADGAYSFTGLASGLNYTVTVTASGYSFSTLTFTSLAANQTGADFNGCSSTGPTREYIRLGGRVIAIANCGAQ